MYLNRGFQPAGKALTARSERHGTEDLGGEEGGAGQQDHQAQQPQHRTRSHRHQGAQPPRTPCNSSQQC